MGGEKKVLEMQAVHSTWEGSAEHAEWTLSQAHPHSVTSSACTKPFAYVQIPFAVLTESMGNSSTALVSVAVPLAFLGVQSSRRNHCPDQAVGHQYTLDKYQSLLFCSGRMFRQRQKDMLKLKYRIYNSTNSDASLQYKPFTLQQRIMGKCTKECTKNAQNNGKMHTAS